MERGYRLKKIYLLGAVKEYENIEKANKWRNEAKEYFSDYLLDFECINPLDYYRYDRNFHKSESEVFKFCMRKVAEADVMLVNLEHFNKSSGSHDEVFKAWSIDKPVIGFYESDKPLCTVIDEWKQLQFDRIETGEDAMEKAMEYIRIYYG